MLDQLLTSAASWRVEHHSNTERASPDASMPTELTVEGMAWAREQATQLPAYDPSPLLAAPELALECGLGQLWLKDETHRLGVGSFKPLGGAIAAKHLLAEVEAKGGQASELVLATASAGNHGLGLAWSCRQAGCSCEVFLSTNVGRPPHSEPPLVPHLGPRPSYYLADGGARL